jgi:2-haloalkanoic acid dehalogenase type II
MTGKGEFPKAIFYDSKNTLWAWEEVYIDVARQILEKYNRKIDPVEFRRTMNSIGAENHRTAFGKFQKFTENLRFSLLFAFRYYGIPGTGEDIEFMTDRWNDVQPFPDTIAALVEQKKITKVLCYSNVETEYLDMMVDKLPEAAKPHFVGDMDKSGYCKPNPLSYRWVLKTAGRQLKMDLQFSDVIYCAGVQWDVQGAMACGMKSCWIRRPYFTTAEPDGLRPDYIIDNLHELTLIVERNLAGKPEYIPLG